MEQQPKYKRKGGPQDRFDKEAYGKYFIDPLFDIRKLLDHSTKRNMVYLVLIIVCVVCTVFVAMTANYRTYVVRVDNATGRVEAGGELKSTNYSPQDAEIKHFLTQFVGQIRSVPLDPVLFKSNWNTAQHFLTQAAGQKLNNLIVNDNPVSKLGKSTVQPVIRSIQLQPGSTSKSSRSYQVRWTEEEFNLSGNTGSSSKINYVALFTIVIQPPTKEDELLINPLGIKIADLSFTRENEATAAKK